MGSEELAATSREITRLLLTEEDASVKWNHILAAIGLSQDSFLVDVDVRSEITNLSEQLNKILHTEAGWRKS